MWVIAGILIIDILFVLLVRAGVMRKRVAPRQEQVLIWVTIICTALVFLIVGSLWVYR